MKNLLLMLTILFVTGIAFANEEFDRMVQAAESGNPTACYNVSLCYQYGYLDVVPDNEQAVTWAKRAAAFGVSDAMVDLGIYYVTFEDDWKTAKKYFKQAAKLENANAFYMMGYCYANALGVKKDIKRGIKNYEKASERGCPAADYQLGRLYYTGEEVPEDTEAALRYFFKVAEGGDTDAQAVLKDLGL